jgi:heavy metal translocating P-type ATPase
MEPLKRWYQRPDNWCVFATLIAMLASFLLSKEPFGYFPALNLAQVPLVVMIVLGGVPLLVQIGHKLLCGDWGADLLAALALITAASLQQWLAGDLIVLMLASGSALEAYAMRRASSVLAALAERMPANTHRRQGELVVSIAIASITIGDDILVYPHETCPVDGVVIAGHGTMDESYLTGEPYQIAKAPGARVISGAINGDTLLEIRAEKLPQDSRYAKIMQVMVEAEHRRPRLRRLADQIGGIFAPIALLAAVISGLMSHDWMRFLSVLVVATPCPLLIAIPVVLISAISQAAHKGIIIRDPTVLERLPQCKTAIFDKTGTLTYGRPQLVHVEIFGTWDRRTVLQYAASAERFSKHPLALAIINAAQHSGVPLLEVMDVTEKPGTGLTAHIANHTLRITSRNLIEKSEPALLQILPPQTPGLECIVLIDDAPAGILSFRDTPRAEGQSFIAHLGPSHQFQKVMLLSGDRESEVRYLADQLGIKDCLASQSPEQKLAIVRKEAALASTLFMGDGINDAPALTAATVGLAFGMQSSVTSEAAGAVILENTLIKVDELLHLSLAMRRVALQSAIGGMVLSLVGMLAAGLGFLTPVAGALSQEFIDILAILNALRLTWRDRMISDVHHH